MCHDEMRPHDADITAGEAHAWKKRQDIAKWLNTDGQRELYRALTTGFPFDPHTREIIIQTLEALADAHRLMFEANKAHDDNWIDSWFTTNKSEIVACLAGIGGE